MSRHYNTNHLKKIQLHILVYFKIFLQLLFFIMFQSIKVVWNTSRYLGIFGNIYLAFLSTYICPFLHTLLSFICKQILLFFPEAFESKNSLRRQEIQSCFWLQIRVGDQSYRGQTTSFIAKQIFTFSFLEKVIPRTRTLFVDTFYHIKW